MFAVYARYRGNDRHRAELVRESAEALATLPGVSPFDIIGVENIITVLKTADACCDVTMALLSHGDWAVTIGVASLFDDTRSLAINTMGPRARAGTVTVGVTNNPDMADDIAGVFCMLGQILGKRTVEGRQATSLMRSGFNQIEAAQKLGISKQAMSQRLQAAGWQAELAGWRLALRLLRAAEQ